MCIKKQMLATCANDRTVRLWSYNQSSHFSLDLCQSFSEETLTVALHPSGCHIVVAFREQVRMMNILPNALVSFKTINIKLCNEI